MHLAARLREIYAYHCEDARCGFACDDLGQGIVLKSWPASWDGPAGADIRCPECERGELIQVKSIRLRKLGKRAFHRTITR